MKRSVISFTCSIALFFCLVNATAFAGWTQQQSPAPGKSLYGIWGSSADDVFAVGESGTIIHFNGSAWSTMPSGTTQKLYGVWGIPGSDVYACGAGGLLLHYDGSTWSPLPSGTTEPLTGGLWGSAANDIFATGEAGTIAHYDGTAWSAITGPTEDSLSGGIWGSAPDSVFAAGAGIIHYDGAGWLQLSLPAASYISGIWGSAADDIFAVGEDGVILHYDGAAWASMQSPGSAWLDSVWGSSSADVFAVGYDGKTGVILHYDGSQWSSMYSASRYSLYGVWGTSAENVFVVGERATILHYDGNPAPAGPCPARAMLGENRPALARLRALRDMVQKKHPEAKKLVAAYYKNAGQLTAILMAHPGLARSFRELVFEALDRVDCKKLTVRDDRARGFRKKILAFMDALAGHAGPALRDELRGSKDFIHVLF